MCSTGYYQYAYDPTVTDAHEDIVYSYKFLLPMNQRVSIIKQTRSIVKLVSSNP